MSYVRKDECAYGDEVASSTNAYAAHGTCVKEWLKSFSRIRVSE